MSAPPPSDEAILDYVFNPGLEGVPTEPPAPSAEDLGPAPEPIEPALLERLRALETRAVGLADRAPEPDLDGALAALDEAVALCPAYASAFNNRAQVRLLRGERDEALEDATRAIELGSGSAVVLGNAYAQRGIVHAARGDEELALDDFRMGAKFGNQYARQQAVRLNPYAALCNRMLSEAMGKLYENKEEEQQQQQQQQQNE